MFENLSKAEVLLLRKAIKHYMIHQLGTHHHDLGKYQAMMIELEKALGNYDICRIG